MYEEGMAADHSKENAQVAGVIERGPCFSFVGKIPPAEIVQPV